MNNSIQYSRRFVLAVIKKKLELILTSIPQYNYDLKLKPVSMQQYICICILKKKKLSPPFNLITSFSMKDRLEKIVLLPFTAGCISESSIPIVQIQHTSRYKQGTNSALSLSLSPYEVSTSANFAADVKENMKRKRRMKTRAIWSMKKAYQVKIGRLPSQDSRSCSRTCLSYLVS